MLNIPFNKTQTKYRKLGKEQPAHIRRLYPLRYHPVQAKGIKSKARYNVVTAGRRSGKTEIFGKRKIVAKAYMPSKYPEGARIGVAAPTRDQVKRIYWRDLKLMINPDFIDGRPVETELMIPLKNKNQIWLLGLDKAERAEGTPWDHLLIDEFGNVKPHIWEENLRPALSDRYGTADLIGVPEGRGLYYKLFKRGKNKRRYKQWNSFTWFSADILPPEEIAEAKEDLDEQVYKQEYEGSFISFGGLIYYNWNEVTHAQSCKEYYNPRDVLCLAFDFNRKPGVCVKIQELQEYEHNVPIIGKTITAVMDIIYIPSDSNTEKICNKVIDLWGKHEGEVHLFGDATGGAKGTAKVKGSDWDIIAKMLRKHWGSNRIRVKVPRANPPQRSRVNAVNSRLRNMAGLSYVVVDPNLEEVIDDFEGVRAVDGTGEIDKKRDPLLTHLTDAIGYYTVFNFPIDDWRPARILQV